jgi:hypothetical protein
MYQLTSNLISCDKYILIFQLALKNILRNRKIKYNQDAEKTKETEEKVRLHEVPRNEKPVYQNKQAVDTIIKNTKDTSMTSTSNGSVGSDEQNSPAFRKFEQVNDDLDSRYQSEEYEETKNNSKKDLRHKVWDK